MHPSPPPPSGRSNSFLRKPHHRVPTLAILLGFALAVTLIWIRNRDLLRDLYDYSSVIVGAGKIKAGLRPYTDFRSTMQSATYALNRGVELLFGANYLALTWGGLIVSLGGGAVLTWLWRRSFGWRGAGVLAGTMAVAGFSQHVVVFYNPIGLLCLAVVAAALAHDSRLWRMRSPEMAIAGLTLVLGGTNKINFQAFTCGLAALLILRAWWMKEVTGRSALASTGMLVLCGAVLPLGLELLWTGATLRQWVDNVLLLPSQRVGLVTAFLHRDIILHPAYDLYHHILFKQLTLAGLVVIAFTAWAAWRGLAGDPFRRRAALWLLLTAPVCSLGGLLLTVTNVETYALTSLAFVVGAAALWAALAGRLPEAVRRRGTILLPAASLLWTVVGGYAAWNGSRVLFGASEPVRSSFIRLDDPSPSIVYLRGVRLDSGLYASLRLTAAELERLKAERGTLSTVLFGPAMEWLERAYPEAILPGMPVWYHQGTALHAGDGPWLQERLASHQVDRIVLNPNWESWPGAFSEYLERHYRQTTLGPVVRMYEARQAEFPPALRPMPPAGLRPLVFCRHTFSNIHINTTRTSPGMQLATSPWGDILGAAGSSRWVWENGVHVMNGAFVAELREHKGAPVAVRWRIVALDSGGERELQLGDTTISSEQPEARVAFAIEPHGSPVRFEIDIAPTGQGRVVAGWRELWIKQAGAADPAPPPAAVDNCEDDNDETTDATTFLRHACLRGATVENGWYPAPFEAWRDCGPTCAPWKVRVGAKHRHDISGAPTIIFLVWYKGGRIEILREQLVNPDDEQTVELEGWMPEPGGWMGVFARAADITQRPNCRVRIESWAP